MNEYWYTDEFGRKRHVNGELNSSHDKNKSQTYSYNNSFSYNYSVTKSHLYITKCPVCDNQVYFCQCSNGGRVFFDTLSPLWKKHPCTSINNDEPKLLKKYSIILPHATHQTSFEGITKKETVFYVPDFLDSMKLNTTNKILHQNLIQYTSILIRKEYDIFYLTIIVTSSKFNNSYFCKDLNFTTQLEIEQFIYKELSKKDFYDDFSPYKESKEEISTVKTSRLKKFLCNDCKKEFFSRESLKRHINTKHQKIDNCKRVVINCKYCDKSFFNICELESHIEKIHTQLNINDLSNKGWTIK